MFINYSNAFLIVLQVDMTSLSPRGACRHSIEMVYLSDHGYDSEGRIMEEIPAGECSYIYLTGDFSFGRLPEEKQLVVIPLLMRTLRMAGLGERSLGPLHPEDEKVTEIRLRYSGFREGDLVEFSLSYTTRYFSLYERPEILVQNPFRRAMSIAELAEENVLGVVSRSLFIGGRVINPPRDKVLMSLQVPTGDCETDRHMRALVKCANNLAIPRQLDIPWRV